MQRIVIYWSVAAVIGLGGFLLRRVLRSTDFTD